MSLQLWGIVFCGGLATTAFVLFFVLGFKLQDDRFERDLTELMHHVMHDRRDLRDVIPDVVGEVVRGRNEFWATFGQLLVATLVVAVLAILLLVKVVRAEAALPIISGIVAFAIGKSPLGQRPTRSLFRQPPEG